MDSFVVEAILTGSTEKSRFPHTSADEAKARKAALDAEGHQVVRVIQEVPVGQEPNIVGIAKAAHEINRAYCSALGDTSQLPWDEAPQWQRDSAINGVRFHMDNPDASPSASHESWLKQKEDEGWKYGPLKDAEKKEHPCFVPYDQLPADQRAKDYLFKAVCKEGLGK